MTTMSHQPAGSMPSTLSILAPADLWRIIRRRVWLIFACFFFFGVCGSGAFVAWWFLWPFYTAEGIVEVEAGQQLPAFVQTQAEMGPPVQLFEQYVQAQALAIRNNRVLDAAIDQLKNNEQLRGRDLLFRGANASHKLGLALDVNHGLNTQTIFVSLTDTDKEQVYLTVTEVLRQYEAIMKAERDKSDSERRRELTQEREDLRKQLTDLGTRLSQMRGEAKILTADDRGSEEMARLVALAHQLTEAQLTLAEANAAWTQFQELKKAADEAKDYTPVIMGFPEITDVLRRDPGITALSEQASRGNQELQGLQQRFGEQHEAVKRMKTAVQGARNDLEAKQNEVLGQLFQQLAATLKSKYDRAKAAEAEIEARVAVARAAAIDVAKSTADFRAREDEFRRAQALLNTVVDGLERMRISQALSRPNVRVSRWPTMPVEPSEPRLILYIPAIVVFSILLGFGLSLLLELVDTRVRTPSDVTRQVGAPLLANVPDLSEDERLSMDTNVALVSQTAPQSLLAESFRQMRTSLLFASDQPIRSVLVTSPNPGDGKSTVAANLAITLARAGSRVLLIDANFRKPSLARVFDVPDRIGLSNVLVGMNPVSEAIQATSIANLDVLTSGVSPPSPAELLGSHSMRQLVVEQMKAYDRVIIDGAPMLVVADNFLLADVVDGIVLVFCAGENTRGMAQRTVRQVLSLRGRIAGAVLNRVRATKGGYFRESFQAYYDYSGASRPVEPVAAAPPKDGPDA
jgi:capsular exopolysaccharide synthesis family protein